MALFEIHCVDEQIKALPTVATAQGSVASFDTDMTEDLIEVVCEIQYSQASGTPTPDNPLPIQVYDFLTLYHNSVNIWNEQWETGSIDTNTGNDTLSNAFVRSVGYNTCVGDTSYYCYSKNGNQLVILWYDINKTYIGYEVATNSAKTSPANARYFRIRILAPIVMGDISINYPSTDTEYHAFNGAYIPFGQTVAKGTLNVTTGVLTITHGYISSYNGESINEPWVSSIDEYVENTNPSTGAEVVYPLTTPTIIQLDSKTITALLNENNIWCDTNGDTKVKFLLSVGKVVNV